MKLILLVLTMALCAQDVELVPLTPTESAQLKALNDEQTRLGAISEKAFKDHQVAQDKFCTALQKIKAAHAAKETSGNCGDYAWATSTGTATNVLLNGRSRWEVDKDFKYLVHTK